jgi:hypothetical protein
MAHKMSILGDSFDDPPVETSIRLMLQTTHSRARAEHKREFRYLIGVLTTIKDSIAAILKMHAAHSLLYSPRL